MKAKNHALTLLAIAALAAAPAGNCAVVEDVTMALSDAPAAVQQTVAQHLNGGQVREIEREMEQGREIYSVEIVNGTRVTEFEVGADGEYLGQENEGTEGEDDDDEQAIPLADAPEGVQRAVAENAPGIDSVTRETEHGVTVYEAEWEEGGVEHSAEFTEAGDTLSREHDMRVNDLPETARAAVAERYPSGEIREVEHVEMVLYEVKVSSGADTEEVYVCASGMIMPNDEGEDEGEEEGEDEEEEQAVNLSDIPEAAQRAFAEAGVGGEAGVVFTRETERGIVVYEAEWTSGGTQHSTEVSEAGELIEEEHGDDNGEDDDGEDDGAEVNATPGQ